ncbi:MAG: O-methyltransferase [Bacilli bacterium]|nr:O-methyltransferase [Bacilli bacterium]MDD4406726.1 O-methyltransferase [Bacilli bacterium]
MKEVITEMERYAIANNVPIIEIDSIKFIMKYIKLNNVKNVLEIGSAIGYSAILMANATDNVEITTIEKDEKRYKEAVKNVNKCGLDKRIDIVFNDALEVNLAGHSYDLIFIDAAKGAYIKFFEKFCHYLNPGGVIITDNLKFHGLVNNKDSVNTKSLRGIVNKIEKYISFLNDNKDYITKFYDIGDGLSVSIKKNNEK